MESVRTFAGQTTTYSFWAKANTGTPKVAIFGVQYFGTAGSPSATVTADYGTVTLSTSWARYSVTCAIPSISGKTLGTSNDDQVSIRLMLSGGSSVANSQSIGVQNYTFETWGHQWEYGSKATPFQTASGGSPQAELAMCQRYYWRTTPAIAAGLLASGSALTTTDSRFAVKTPVTMRVIPTAIDFSSFASISLADGVNAELTSTGIALITSTSSQDLVQVYVTVASGLTAFRPYYLKANASASAFIGFTSEL